MLQKEEHFCAHRAAKRCLEESPKHTVLASGSGRKDGLVQPVLCHLSRSAAFLDVVGGSTLHAHCARIACVIAERLVSCTACVTTRRPAPRPARAADRSAASGGAGAAGGREGISGTRASALSARA